MLIAGVISTYVYGALGIIGFASLVIGGYFAVHYKTAELALERAKNASEASAEWRDNYMAERARADDLEKRYQEQRALKHDALNDLAAERLKTDLSGLMQMMVKKFDSIDNRLGRIEESHHEQVETLRAISGTQHEIAALLHSARPTTS